MIRIGSEDRLLVVDGKRLVARRGVEGETQYEWLSEPNADCGFGSSYAGDDHDEHVAAVRRFLTIVDPATGYIGD